MKASSTLAAVLAEVSMKTSPCSRAKASPSSRFTSRRASRSLQEHACQISLVIVQKFSRPFVANEHDHHVAVAVLPGIFQPSGLRRCKKNIDHEISICLKMRTSRRRTKRGYKQCLLSMEYIFLFFNINIRNFENENEDEEKSKTDKERVLAWSILLGSGRSCCPHTLSPTNL